MPLAVEPKSCMCRTLGSIRASVPHLVVTDSEVKENLRYCPNSGCQYQAEPSWGSLVWFRLLCWHLCRLAVRPGHSRPFLSADSSPCWALPCPWLGPSMWQSGGTRTEHRLSTECRRPVMGAWLWEIQRGVNRATARGKQDLPAEHKVGTTFRPDLVPQTRPVSLPPLCAPARAHCLCPWL